MRVSKKVKMILTFIVISIVCLLAANISNAAYTSNDINGIDESKYPGYKALLQQIQAQYPNWKINLYYTGLNWNDVIENENTGHGKSPKSLIQDTYDESWQCHEPGCYGVKYDVSKRWYCASQVAIEYMMDPRNSLDEDYIFQFQDLSSSVGDRKAIEKMVEGTFLNKESYIDAIMEAAQAEGISPFHIVARIKQEQGSDGSGEMNGYAYTTESGEVVTVYNLYNINVSGNDTEAGLLAGAKYAYEQGWTSAEASIKGGASYLKTNYINVGQTTLYFQKFNVVDSNNLYNHQYMQNIRAANDEGNIMYKAYKNAGILDSTFEFTIPIYENMPQKACPRPQYIKVQSISSEQNEYTIGIDEAITINYTYSPSNATNTDFSWTSSNPEVLRVYWNQIRGLKAGDAEIIIRTSDGTVEKRVKVHVKSSEDIKVVPEKETYTIGVNEAVDIKCTYTPSNLKAEDFSWTASNPSILSVYWDRMRGLKAGTTDLIIKSLDGTYEKRIKVVVEKNEEGIKVVPEKETYTIGVNEAIDIKCTYTPSNLKAEDFSWTASNPSILSVYWDRMRGLKAGTTDLIIKSLDGTYEKRIKVVVEKNEEGIKVVPEKETYTIGVNEAIDIKCTYTPSNLKAEDFSWTASNPSILSVYWDRMRGLKAGTTDLIIKSLDGTYEKKIKVVVEKTGINVVPEKETYTIGVNEAIDIKCTYTPSNLKAEDFSWTASNPSILSVYWDRMRGLKAGTTDLIIKSLDGTYEKKIKVVVEKTGINVVPEKETYTIGVNEAIDIKCTYTPSNLKAEDFSWTTSNPSILSVYWDRMRGLKAGTTDLIIKSLDGTYEKRIKVVVEENKSKAKVIPEAETNTITQKDNTTTLDKEQTTGIMKENTDSNTTNAVYENKNKEALMSSENKHIVQ